MCISAVSLNSLHRLYASVCRFEQSLTKSVSFGLRIGEMKYENELNLVHNNCRKQIHGILEINDNKNIDKLSVIIYQHASTHVYIDLDTVLLG